MRRAVSALREGGTWLGRYFVRKWQLLTAVTFALAALAAAAGQGSSVPVQGAALPLSGMVIVVDAGHGGYDGGACGVSGVWEKVINLQLARHTADALREKGAEVVMTRTEDVDFCSEPRPAELTKKRQDMIARVEIAKACEADMVLSIHMNHYRDRSQSGPQVFYREGCDSGRLLAGCMQESLIAGLAPKKKRAALAGDYFILQLDVPSVLIECGFLSNPAEEKLLRDGAYQQRVASAIADGAAAYAALARMTQQ